MATYLLVLFLVYVLSLCIRRRTKTIETVDGYNRRRIYYVEWVPTIAICLILALCAGVRDHVGTDFSTYEGLFQYYMMQPVSETLNVSEGLFWSVASVLGKLTDNVSIVFLFFAIAIVFCEIPTIEKYSINVPLSFFLYITSMQYFNGFNGIRQSTAAAIIFAAFPLLLQRKWIKYIALVGVVFFVHNSVILLIPITIFASLDPESKRFKWIFGLLLVCFYLFPGIIDRTFSILTPDNYQHFLVLDESDDGVNILRVLVAALPVIISRIYYTKLKVVAPDIRVFKYVVNFSAINLLVLILATRSTVLARFGMYTSIYNVILIPCFLGLFVKEQKKVLTLVIMILFLLYMCFLLPTDSNLLPYQTIFKWAGNF